MSVNPVYDPILHLGDSKEFLYHQPENSVDAIVCDPPYLLSFMGKGWDKAKDNIAVDVEFWRRCLACLKPGGYLLAFGGTRTSHRMVCAIEDAGFEIRDGLRTPCWLYGSGFPKSYNIAKGVEGVLTQGSASWNDFHKLNGEKGDKVSRGSNGFVKNNAAHGVRPAQYASHGTLELEPTTDEAKQWVGWGTALKPSWEPLCMARKPLSEKNVASNVLQHGTGGLNIDVCRVGTQEVENGRAGRGVQKSGTVANEGGDLRETERTTVTGRWPANVILSPADAARIDAQSGVARTGIKTGAGLNNSLIYGNSNPDFETTRGYGDSGGASRFFHTVDFEPGELDYLNDFAPLYYVAKASQAERHAGCENLPAAANRVNAPRENEAAKFAASGGNHHPTVKPVSLCSILCRLVCPPSGIILDPFMGSGSMGIAAIREGFQYIGIEREHEYMEIARKRIQHEIEQAQTRAMAKVPTLFDE